MAKKWTWRKDYGDGCCTDDSVLWIDGKPTNNCVSGISSCCHTAYVDDVNLGIYFDTVKEAKQAILEELGLIERKHEDEC